ncbi:hypothetical protein PENANT_c027G07312 [Penicillium antarcticum]|uniref:Uncharacterized protein n=1 Tax=Penicillium antarcticum TaxID=416450 RepID=A0A1V6PWQ2_9EURO|nr:hypothetical protein PENANT_c027G07312 [Penicillium antarcticum]
MLFESDSDRRCIFEVSTLSHFTLTQEFLPAIIAADYWHVGTASFYSQVQTVSCGLYGCYKLMVQSMSKREQILEPGDVAAEAVDVILSTCGDSIVLPRNKGC